MKTILRDKIVKEVTYISDDGVEFKNILDCENHEMKVDKASTDLGKTRLKEMAAEFEKVKEETHPQRLDKVVSSEIVDRDICEIVYNEILGVYCPSCHSNIWFGEKVKKKLQKKFFCYCCGARLIMIRKVMRGNEVVDNF